MTEHQQVIIKGTNIFNNEQFNITCDEEIADLIYTLNTHGVKTKYSCQGDNYKQSLSNSYVVIESPPLPKLLNFANILIRNFWKEKYLITTITPQGDINFTALTNIPKHNQLYFLLEFNKK